MGSSPLLLLRVLLCVLYVVSVHAWEIQYRAFGEDGNPLDEPMERISIIFPGTKWCGSGNKAKNKNDLGKHNETDACCRTHDMCPDLMNSGESKHGLTNTAFYTRLSCACDDAFLKCLHKSKDGIGGLVGRTYFDVLGTQCYRLDYPIVRCKRKTFFRRQCLEYELDTCSPKKYQWFDVPEY